MSRRKSEVLAQNSHQISVHLFAFCWIRRDLDSCAFYMHDAIPLLFFFFFVLSTSSLQQMEFYCKQLLIPEEATHRHHSVWCFIPFYIFHNKKRTNTQIVCGRRWPMALRSAYVPLRYIFICHLLYGTSPWHEIYWLMCFYVCLSFWSGLPQQSRAHQWSAASIWTPNNHRLAGWCKLRKYRKMYYNVSVLSTHYLYTIPSLYGSFPVSQATATAATITTTYYAGRRMNSGGEAWKEPQRSSWMMERHQLTARSETHKRAARIITIIRHMIDL